MSSLLFSASTTFIAATTLSISYLLYRKRVKPICIEGIVFDLDGTLIDYEGAFSRIVSFLTPREVKGLSQTGILYFGQVFFGYDFTSNFYDQISNIKNLIMKSTSWYI